MEPIEVATVSVPVRITYTGTISFYAALLCIPTFLRMVRLIRLKTFIN
jgi:hypothetical protein